jgi:prephenate dehydratase
LSWSNNQSHAPISSLRCAKTSLYEIARKNIPDEHQDCMRFRLK